MGKCKRRSLYKSNSTYFMTRENAVNNVFKLIENTKNNSKFSRKKSIYKDVLNTISLFGISAEELSEAGLAYENLKALGSVVN